jgi:hypothetical protein
MPSERLGVPLRRSRLSLRIDRAEIVDAAWADSGSSWLAALLSPSLRTIPARHRGPGVPAPDARGVPRTAWTRKVP